MHVHCAQVTQTFLIVCQTNRVACEEVRATRLCWIFLFGNLHLSWTRSALKEECIAVSLGAPVLCWVMQFCTCHAESAVPTQLVRHSAGYVALASVNTTGPSNDNAMPLLGHLNQSLHRTQLQACCTRPIPPSRSYTESSNGSHSLKSSSTCIGGCCHGRSLAVKQAITATGAATAAAT